MPNGKPHDSPPSDMTIHGMHPFPADIEKLLKRADEIGRGLGRWPLGENWPYSPQEFGWERGENLDQARSLLVNFVEMLESGRGDEILLDPRTGKPFSAK